MNIINKRFFGSILPLSILSASEQSANFPCATLFKLTWTNCYLYSALVAVKFMAATAAASSISVAGPPPKSFSQKTSLFSSSEPATGRRRIPVPRFSIGEHGREPCIPELCSVPDKSGSLDCCLNPSPMGRRELFWSSIGMFATAVYTSRSNGAALASQFADMPALRGKDYGKSKMHYPDYTETSSGLQYKDLKVGSGPNPKMGDIVVVDWDGYTIGYYGRIFEARNKTKGGSFEGDDKDFYKFILGSDQVIPAFEEAISGMAVGGIRRIIVPPELGYPDNDFNKKGPSPLTFSGQRALDFVLRNQGLIDKTLLFDIELLKIVPS
ncbi:unnamed protein product [Cuscuta europaea]|uniref:peptidylprolyl isomerase n=1 Tax=Cuscuta europaea TaxID=41803 RepID=A0A9P1E5H5_CUSEU|nr:unnamed protein product [Cuscuta europaea]